MESQFKGNSVRNRQIFTTTRPCDISRRLGIFHGGASKPLSKYGKDGLIQHGCGEGVGRPRVITPHLAARIGQYLKKKPGIYSWEIRDRLVKVRELAYADSIGVGC